MSVQRGKKKFAAAVPEFKETDKHLERVIVKFVDGFRVKLPEGEKQPQDERDKLIARLIDAFPGITIANLYTDESLAILYDLSQIGQAASPEYRAPDWASHYAIVIPLDSDIKPEAVVGYLRGEGGDDSAAIAKLVESAYTEPKEAPAPSCISGSNPLAGNQGYLNAAPQGIDARCAWEFPGGCGTGAKLRDFEKGWSLQHKDFPMGITLISGLNNSEFDHGTKVLGVIGAADNTIGVIGIAHEATINTVSIFSSTGLVDYPNQLTSALAGLSTGDIVLLEVQVLVNGNLLPLEADPALFSQIQMATTGGIVIVEAAGNGGLNLDVSRDAASNLIWAPGASPSNAIMVGAATSQERKRATFGNPAAEPSGCGDLGRPPSNYGSRIDCYAWGECVETATASSANDCNTTSSTPDNLCYDPKFNGTSSASAIVAGAALAIQGMKKAKDGSVYSNALLRGYLKNNGTPSYTPATDLIGVMPDLKKIVTAVLQYPLPDLYIRDNPADIGNPHTGPISASPDIIVLPSQVPSTSAFSTPGGTTAEFGQYNFVYARVFNRGMRDANDVKVTVYWSPVATLITPNMWKLVGTTTIPQVPQGNIGTVSPAITWSTVPAINPTSNHYCFVAVIDHACDPAPDYAAIANFVDFYAFIRAENNVTWRNFDVIDTQPNMLGASGAAGAGSPSGAGMAMIQIPFLVTGAPDIARPMQLQIQAELPPRAKVWLEGPVVFMRTLLNDPAKLEISEARDIAWHRLEPDNITQLAEVDFPANLQAEMRLLIDLPEESRKDIHEITVRQLYQGQEVGSVGRRLAPGGNETGDGIVRDLTSLARGHFKWLFSILIALVVTLVSVLPVASAVPVAVASSVVLLTIAGWWFGIEGWCEIVSAVLWGVIVAGILLALTVVLRPLDSPQILILVLLGILAVLLAIIMFLRGCFGRS